MVERLVHRTHQKSPANDRIEVLCVRSNIFSLSLKCDIVDITLINDFIPFDRNDKAGSEISSQLRVPPRSYRRISI